MSPGRGFRTIFLFLRILTMDAAASSGVVPPTTLPNGSASLLRDGWSGMTKAARRSLLAHPGQVLPVRSLTLYTSDVARTKPSSVRSSTWSLLMYVSGRSCQWGLVSMRSPTGMVNSFPAGICTSTGLLNSTMKGVVLSLRWASLMCPPLFLILMVLRRNSPVSLLSSAALTNGSDVTVISTLMGIPRAVRVSRRS